MRSIRAKMLNALVLIALLGYASVSGKASAQQSDIEAVRAANAAYYAALSARSIAEMEKIWARTPRDVNIAPPIRPTAHVGWDAVRANFATFWDTLDELSVSMEQPAIEVRGSVAWVYGIEASRRRTKSGQVSVGTNFGTSIFVKSGDRWLMVFHQAALIPPRP